MRPTQRDKAHRTKEPGKNVRIRCVDVVTRAATFKSLNSNFTAPRAETRSFSKNGNSTGLVGIRRLPNYK